MRRVRIATFNLLNGRSPDAETVDVDRFCRAVARLDADLLALQEVDRDQPRSGGHDLTALAAGAMGADEYRFAAALTGTPDGWAGATGVEPDGTPAYGIALLSRYPVTDLVRRTPAARSGADPPPSRTGACDWTGCATSRASRSWPTSRRRSDRCAVAATHLSFLPVSSGRQLRRLVQRSGPSRWPDRAAGRPEHVTAAGATDHRHAAAGLRADVPEPLARRTAGPRAQ